ncbi:MAG: SDR family NAD(P)-dependent oxidoreductase [Myxococcota bacterium]|nr:SDR family NAD(P)-dependent oxidoreductase [Myxococcota bacterium]
MEQGFRGRYGPWAAVLGAGQGIGLAFAREIARRGVDVLAVDLRAEGAEAARAAATQEGARAEARTLDLADPAAAARLEEVAQGRTLGLVVCSAAVSLVGPFLDAPLARHLEAVGVNCAGAVRACHVLGTRLAAQGRGGVVLLSSLAGFQGTGFVASYAASKAFTLSLAEALWWELGPRGVDVVAVAPGSTDTPGFLAHGPRVDREALASPEEVAREGLDGLGRGPLVVPGEANRRIRDAMAALPRTRAVEVMSEQTRRMYPSGRPEEEGRR